MQAALDRASEAERIEQVALQQAQVYFGSDAWLEGATGAEALTLIDDAEFEINRLLAEDCGALGEAFKQSDEYEVGMRTVTALRTRHQALVPVSPAVGIAVPVSHVVETVADPLAHHGKLMCHISDPVLADPRNFNVLMGGVRGESTKSEDEAPWKAAALTLYTRHKANNPNAELPTFDELWSRCYDRRLDARVIGHYARLSDEPGFLCICRSKLFRCMDDKSMFTEVELRDYYIMAFGDNLVRIHGERGTGIWWMRRWKWDDSGLTIAHMVMHAFQNLYHDLLTHHRQQKEQLVQADSVDPAKLKKIEDLISRTAKALSSFGHQQNKNVIALIQSQLDAHSLELDPFDEDRYLFCFTNKVFNFKTASFQQHFKFDYMLKNCGREWREPTKAHMDKMEAVFTSIQPDEESRKSLLSMLRGGLTGVRIEYFIIMTGGGRNGKGVVVEMHQFTLGTYALAGHLSTITKPIKSGPNTELREMHKVRTIVFSEPEEDAQESLRLSNIKMITGNESQNARGLYSSRSQTSIHATFFLECNKLPHIVGDKGESARERVCILPFVMTFTDKPDKLRENPETHRPLDKSLKSRCFKEEHYCAYFKLLVTSDLLKDVPIDDVYITKASWDLAGTYLDNNDFMPSWVNEHYKVIESDTHVAFAPIKEMYTRFRESDMFQDLSKRERKLLTETKFRDAIAHSNKYKTCYREAHQVRVHGKSNTSIGLVNYVPIDQSLVVHEGNASFSGASSSSSSAREDDPKRQRVCCEPTPGFRHTVPATGFPPAS